MKTVIQIPRNSRVFVLDDNEARLDFFRTRLYRTDFYSEAKTAPQAIEILSSHQPFDFIFLDHDLGYVGETGDGKQVAKHLRDNGSTGLRIVIHSWSPNGADAMHALLPLSKVVPFGQFDIEVGD